jgi:hypothetical protein
MSYPRETLKVFVPSNHTEKSIEMLKGCCDAHRVLGNKIEVQIIVRLRVIQFKVNFLD